MGIIRCYLLSNSMKYNNQNNEYATCKNKYTSYTN